MSAERRPERAWAAVAAALEALGVALRGLDGAAPAPPASPVQVTLPWSVLLARPDLVPDDALLTVSEAAAALGISRAGIYKRTSRWHREHGTAAPLPHVRVEGALRFRAGELRQWQREREHVVVAGRVGPLLVERPKGAA